MLSLVGTAADERDVSCSVLDPDHDDHDTSLPDMRCFWRQTLSSLPPYGYPRTPGSLLQISIHELGTSDR